VLGLAACSLQHPLESASQAQAAVGKPAPDFSGTDLDGKPVRLADFAAHPVVLNFWASWCGPCRAEQPGLNNLARVYAGRGVQFLGIAVRDNVAQARIHRDEFAVPYRSVFDQAARLEHAYAVDAPPSTVLVDSRGVVVFEVTGALSEKDLAHLIDVHLLKS
jgi:thiol-disulfide isomerase/thioredoxin